MKLCFIFFDQINNQYFTSIIVHKYDFHLSIYCSTTVLLHGIHCCGHMSSTIYEQFHGTQLIWHHISHQIYWFGYIACSLICCEWWTNIFGWIIWNHIDSSIIFCYIVHQFFCPNRTFCMIYAHLFARSMCSIGLHEILWDIIVHWICSRYFLQLYIKSCIPTISNI